MGSENSQDPQRPFPDLRPGSHLCCIFETEEERRAVLLPFLLQGLERREKVLCVVGEHTAETLLGTLREAAVDIETAVASGQIVLLNQEEVVFRNGRLAPERMIEFLCKETRRALAEGWSAVRGTFEPTWALHGEPGSVRLIKHEAALNELVRGRGCLLLCLYDRRQVAPDDLLSVLHAHPMVFFGEELVENPFSLPPGISLIDRVSGRFLEWANALLVDTCERVERAKSEGQFLSFAEAAEQVFWILELDPERIVYVSPAFERIWERAVADFEGDVRVWVEAIHPDDRPAVTEAFERWLRGEPGVRYDVTYRILTPAAQVRWIADRGCVLARDGERITRVGGIAEDITDRVQVDEALRENEKRVRRKLDAILSPEADTEALELADILDTEKIQKLVDDFYRMTNVGIGIIDLQGNVLVSTGWQDICIKFHRAQPESGQLCLESDVELSRDVLPGSFKLYRCKNNMWNIATPILLGDRHVGNIFLGQFLFDDEVVDHETFKEQARRFGFDEEAYLAALDRVPRLGRATVEAAMSFHASLAGMIGDLSYSNIRLASALEQRRQVEERLLRLNRELRAIRSCNQALMRAEDESSLLGEICRIVCEEAGYRMAWIGYAESDAAQSVRAVAHAGVEAGYLVAANVSWADTERGRGPTGQAIRSGRPIWVEDFATDPRFAPWRQDAMERGYRSSIALPLKDRSSRAFGALNIYSSTPEAFTAEEVRLLEQLADDLAFGIIALQARVERQSAEEGLLRSELILREAQRVGRIGSWDWDATTDTVTLSDEYYRIFGLDPVQNPPGYAEHLKAYTPESAARLDAAVRRNLETGEPYELDLELAREDGPNRWITVRSETKRAADGRVIGLRGTAQDITERKQVEKMLRESEEQFSAAFQLSPDLIALTRMSDGTILEVNEAYTRMLGYTREESIGKTTSELSVWVDPADRETFMASLEASGEVNGLETRFRRKDGTEIVCLDSARTIEFGGQACVLSVVRDITERKRDEAALRASEERYRTLFEHSPAGVFRSTTDGRLLLANEAFARLLGYPTVEEALQTAMADFYTTPSGRDRFLTLLREQGAVRNLELELRRRDGSPLWVVASATLVPDQHGERTEIEGNLVDFTDRRRLEHEMRRLVEVVEQAAETIVITDTDGTIVYVNPAFSRSAGYTRDEALGANPRILKSGRHPEEFYRDLWRTITRGDVWHGRFTNRRKDGTEYEEEATISPVRDDGGRIAHYVAVKRDVTQEVVLEAQLRHAQKMDAIGRLAGGIAHDFNNVLQALLAHVQLLRAAPEHLESGIAEVEAQVVRGGALARQLLLFSRSEPLRRQRLDLNEVIGSGGTLIRRLVRENVELVVTPCEGVLWVDADRNQIEQVLMNLVVNAVDAMPGGGRVCIRTGRRKGHAWFEVEDTGCGIREDVRERIFDPFFTTKAAGLGTGLGLSVVHGIVEQHGGSIELESVEGAGTTFRVLLPREATGEYEHVPVPRTEEPVPPGHGERILVVEDEETTRRALHNLLTSLGYEVETVGTGAEAGLVASESTFALLLTDVMLPDANGVSLARELSGRSPALKVVLMSGYRKDEAARDLAALGAVDFLQKPFDMGTLARALRRALDAGAGAGDHADPEKPVAP